MDGATFARAAGVLVVSGTLAACGGDDATTTTREAEPASLPQPIHPRCGMDAYSRAEVRRAPTEDGRGVRWTLEYNQKQDAKTVLVKVLLVEYPPINRSLKPPPQAKSVTVGGHRIHVTTPRRGSNVYSAQWTTERAVYSVLAQTSKNPRSLTPPPIERLVSCLP